MKNRKVMVIVLLITAILIALIPLFVLKGAEFTGADDAGSQMVEEIQGEEYEPWFEPILEKQLGGELPGEVESLIFCLQTGIGVGVLAFFMGRFYERSKWRKTKDEDEK